MYFCHYTYCVGTTEDLDLCSTTGTKTVVLLQVNEIVIDVVSLDALLATTSSMTNTPCVQTVSMEMERVDRNDALPNTQTV